ncbi:hypothetical protein J5U22_02140 [Saccharolobus shibatae]|uniref:Uncharacterized protein n=1 Tax=Saccharolobus shibatae TaxID=2286 RepID=A0A8F5GZQ3_9CREN|nr:hypothetical protein J5U22_02140 [Saccharolobus shibatae]
MRSLLNKTTQWKRLSEQEYLILMNYYNTKNMDYLFTELRNIRNELKGIMESIDKKFKEAMDYADKARKESTEYADKNKKEIIVAVVLLFLGNTRFSVLPIKFLVYCLVN